MLLKTSLALSLVTLAVFASAQQFSTSTANGTAGSVSGAPSGSSSFQGLSGSAAGATIGYSTSDGSSSSEAKFNTGGDSTPQGKTFNGASGRSANGFSNAKGSSSVASGSESYYAANFSQNAGDGGGPSGSSGGTYDPWPVHYGDVSGFGSSADLYFQTGLRQTGSLGATGFSLLGGGSGTYGFDAYITVGTVRQELFSFTIGPQGLITDSYTARSGFRIALLDPATADSASASPLVRLSGGTTIVGSEDFDNTLRLYVNPDGSLSRDLQFGILRTGFSVPASGNPSDVLFSWHADVTTHVQGAPEPATLLPIGLGLLALMRRRRVSGLSKV